MPQHSGPPPLPAPLRATLGIIATIADALQDGRGIPDKVLELPVLAVSTALQLSLRAQQQFAAMTVRGDELLTQLRGGATDDPPPWAEFDDDATARPPAAAGLDVAGEPSAAKATGTNAAKKAAKKPAAKVAKKVATPRTGKPSAFDLVGD